MMFHASRTDHGGVGGSLSRLRGDEWGLRASTIGSNRPWPSPFAGGNWSREESRGESDFNTPVTGQSGQPLLVSLMQMSPTSVNVALSVRVMAPTSILAGVSSGRESR